MVVSPAKRKWKGSERGTDPGGVVAASAEIEGGRGARGSQKGVKGDERGLPRAPRGRGSFIPGSRLATSSRISPSRSPATCHLPPWLRPNLLRHVSVPLSLYPSLPSLNPLFYLSRAAVATAAATTIDPYFLLLRGTFARIASGLAPRKSSKGTRVRVFLLRGNRVGLECHANPRDCGFFELTCVIISVMLCLCHDLVLIYFIYIRRDFRVIFLLILFSSL